MDTYSNPRNRRSHDELNELLLIGAELSKEHGFPIIRRTRSVPDRAIPFDKARARKDGTEWVHFFVKDAVFHPMLVDPFKYLSKFRNRKGIYSPDCSIIVGHPTYRNIAAIGKSREIAAAAIRAGFDVIPAPRWGTKDTWDICFEGIEPGGTVAVGTIGCTKDPELRSIFKEGIPELLRRLIPTTVVVHGPLREDVFEPILDAGIRIAHFPSETTLAKEACAHGAR